MIQDDVAAVVFGSNQFTLNSWTPLHDAGIPVFMASAPGNPDVSPTRPRPSSSAPASARLNLIIGAAKEAKTKKVVGGRDRRARRDPDLRGQDAVPEGRPVDWSVVPVALGTADMTPQMQKVVSDNPKGVVFVLGNDTFCIAAFNGLRTAGFKGTVTSIPQCLSDATRTAVPADFLEGHQDLGHVADRHPEGPVDQAVLRGARQVRGVGRRQDPVDRRVHVPGHRRLRRGHGEPEG